MGAHLTKAIDIEPYSISTSFACTHGNGVQVNVAERLLSADTLHRFYALAPIPNQFLTKNRPAALAGGRRMEEQQGDLWLSQQCQGCLDNRQQGIFVRN